MMFPVTGKEEPILGLNANDVHIGIACGFHDLKMTPSIAVLAPKASLVLSFAKGELDIVHPLLHPV